MNANGATDHADALSTPLVPGEEKGLRIDLALSGGGFRAVLFHIGVIRFLYEHRFAGDDGHCLLDRVARICTVSGGSILGAHLVANWTMYTGEPDEFNKAVRQLLRVTTIDLRGRVLRRWLLGLCFLGIPRLFFRLRRIDLLARQYRRHLVQNLRLCDLRDSPRLEILATSYTTGGTVCFAKEGTTFYGELPIKLNDHPIGANWTVADAVAASCAFPPLFPPLRRSSDQLEAKLAPQAIGDGGIRDNLGVEFISRVSGGPTSQVLLVSNAGKPFDWRVEQGGRLEWLVARASRTADIQMDKIGRADLADAQRTVNPQSHLVHGDIGAHVGQPRVPDLTPETRQSLAQIRTDLNPFSDLEAFALVNHGYSAAQNSWTALGPSIDPVDRDTRFWDDVIPRPGVNGSIDDALTASRRTPIGICSWRDLATYPLLGGCVLWIAAIILAGLLGARWLMRIGQHRPDVLIQGLPTATVLMDKEGQLYSESQLVGMGTWLKDTIWMIPTSDGRLFCAKTSLQDSRSTVCARPFGCNVVIKKGYKAQGRLALARIHHEDKRLFEEIPLGRNGVYRIPRTMPDHELWYVCRVGLRNGASFPAEKEEWRDIITFEVAQEQN